MPLKLIAPIPGRTPYYWVRGTYLRVYVERSTQARKQKVAQTILRNIEREIELGVSTEGIKSFASAATSYMQAGGEPDFLRPLLLHFGTKPLSKIDQEAIDAAAEKIYPRATAATKNRQIYTPISAVLKHAGVQNKINRPKGWRGSKRTSWLEPKKAFAILKEATKIDVEFGLVCLTLLYTGMRLGECLDGLACEQISLERGFAYVPDTKTGEPRGVFLPPKLVKALKRHPRGLKRTGRFFRFHDGGRFRDLLKLAAKNAGVKLPPRTAFHIFRHTYGTWMRDYGKLDAVGLIRTGVWSDLESVERYAHSRATVEARKAALLPFPD